MFYKPSISLCTHFKKTRGHLLMAEFPFSVVPLWFFSFIHPVCKNRYLKYNPQFIDDFFFLKISVGFTKVIFS